MKKWICNVCGHLHEGAAPPDICPICGVGPEHFDKYPGVEARPEPPAERAE